MFIPVEYLGLSLPKSGLPVRARASRKHVGSSSHVARGSARDRWQYLEERG
jgi:hypothetical protein